MGGHGPGGETIDQGAGPGQGRWKQSVFSTVPLEDRGPGQGKEQDQDQDHGQQQEQTHLASASL